MTDQVKTCWFCGAVLSDGQSIVCNQHCDNADANDGTYPMLYAVYKFQEKFGIPMASEPTRMSRDIAEFRVKFIQEELDEYKTALEKDDLNAQLDALVDMTYVILGTALRQGMGDIFERAFARVHTANMRKQLEDGPANRANKGLIKPPGWTPPDFTDLLEYAS